LKQEDFDKIERYIKGVADDSEKKYVESLFLNGEENLYLRDRVHKEWDIMFSNPTTTEVNLSHLLDRIHHLIRKKETLKRQKPVQKFLHMYRKIAAILIIPLIIAGGITYSLMGKYRIPVKDQLVSSTIYAPLGARVTFNLPDGTKGMLNSGSHLSYSLPFTNNRKINLDGEAWFEVNHDENHPFVISVGNSEVKVIGTSFNLSAYPAENYIEIVLKEGKVEFKDRTVDENIIVLPSERLIFRDGKTNKSSVDPLKYNAWTEGKLIFREDTMSEVARRIERWYNVRIILADKELENYSFRATFEDDSLEEVLRCLALTSPIRFKITPRILMPDGTFNKEEVIIYMKK